MESDVILVIVVVTALAFDFTNGFHDTANVVASAISTRALAPRTAIALASILNFVGAFVSLKVAAHDGAVDVSQVLAAIDWVVQHHDDPGLNIRVLNLAYGTMSMQSHQVDPIAFAVENAWRHGIVTVVGGGNDGTSGGFEGVAPGAPPALAVTRRAPARNESRYRRKYPHQRLPVSAR